MRAEWLALMLVPPLGAGCGAGEDEPPTASGGAGPCEIELADGSCPGLPLDLPCAPGELQLDDGRCQPAGVPEDGCGVGFTHDGDRGCEPVLPAEPCPPGQLAIPGQTACQPVAPCGSGTWGDIPVEGSTQHVDRAYSGGTSDGSPSRPWTTIQAAVDAAEPGAVVAVAAGSYAEDVLVAGKAVRLWGRCPSMVELVAVGPSSAALSVEAAASGTEVHDLALVGNDGALIVRNAGHVLVDRCWAHHSDGGGISAHNEYGPTDLTVRRSLVEQNAGIGLSVAGVTLDLSESVIRHQAPSADDPGWGLNVMPYPGTQAPAQATVARSVFAGNVEVAVFVSGADLTLDDSLVQATLPNAQGLEGRGLSLRDHSVSGARSQVVVRGSVVSDNHSLGAFVSGSDLTVERTVIAATQPEPAGHAGRGLSTQVGETTGQAPVLTVRASLVTDNHELGVYGHGGEVTLEGVALRDTRPDIDGRGWGLLILADRAVPQPAQLVMRGSVVERNAELGLVVHGASATIETTALREGLPSASGDFGRALQVQQAGQGGTPSALALQSSLVEHHRDVGVLVLSSAATITSCRIAATTPDGTSEHGDGILIGTGFDVLASAQISLSRIDDNARAGISSFGATVELTSNLLLCNAFALDGEPSFTSAEQPYAFVSHGENACGCPQPTEACKVVSANLAPPAPLPPPDEL